MADDDDDDDEDTDRQRCVLMERWIESKDSQSSVRFSLSCHFCIQQSKLVPCAYGAVGCALLVLRSRRIPSLWKSHDFTQQVSIRSRNGTRTWRKGYTEACVMFQITQ